MSVGAIKFIISGKVQGVGFRFSVQDRAQDLALTGYAKNMSDGTVEILVCGEKKGVTSFSAWLRESGPSFSSISNISEEEVPLEEIPSSFSVM